MEFFAFMEPFASQRAFRSPGDVRGIPGVAPRTPIPKRETPLAGTKTMLCPKDVRFREFVTGHATAVIPPSRMAQFLGVLAMAFAVIVIASYWVHKIFPGEWIRFAWNFAGLGVFHLLVIFSQILSSGRNLLGALALVVLYAGLVLSVIVDWLVV